MPEHDDTFHYLKIYLLNDLAYEAYRDKDYELGIRYYDELQNLAKRINDKPQIIHSQFWKSECLFFAGRYKEALAQAMEALSNRQPDTDKALLLYIYSLILQISLTIPVSLHAIENSLEKTKQFIQQFGESHWRATYLYNKSDLLRKRGLYVESFEAAQEGWSVWKDGYPSYYADEYL